MDKLLTVSVASYNIEKYIDKLMESFIDADVFDDVEILLINDGSCDNTAEKAMAYQTKYSNSVRLINKPNGGHGSTINKGIEEATGKYFRALDGDDWINPVAFKRLVGELKSIDVDLILSDYCKCYEDGRREVVSFEALKGKRFYTFNEVATHVRWMQYHTIIYRTQLLKEHDIRLDEHCFYVDTEYNLYPIPYVESIYYFEDYIYCYRLGLNDQSVSPESRRRHINDSRTVANSLLHFVMCLELRGVSKVKNSYIIRAVANHCVWHIQSLVLFLTSKEKKKELIEFDKNIQKISPVVYEAMENIRRYSKIIKILRMLRYRGYRIVCWYTQKNSDIL